MTAPNFHPEQLPLPPVLPVGTKVVVRVALREHAAGAVGVIVQSPVDPQHAYRVRFMDGVEASLKREELVVLKHYQREGGTAVDAPVAEYDFKRHVILRCVIGSRAYGLDHAGSDTDYRGVYLPPPDLQWSLFGVPEQLEDDATQETYWELQKFLVLALKANPNVLECLYTPLVEHATPLAEELLAMRAAFLSKLVYQTYNGYVMSQFKKLSSDLRNKGEVKWKHVMHLIRLLLSGVTALREAVVPVRVEEHRERLLAIRRGELQWDEVDGWRVRLHEAFDAAFAATTLPERPDYAAVNAFLVKARRAMVER
ncbi:MAG: putative nucleotidyltransferase [Phycisphaerales bacterium]|nr:putative nucleotidyltransferase [Phycisphaerales bacterium]